MFACVHAPARDGADFPGHDLAVGTFVELPGYVPWRTRPTAVVAPSLGGFLERLVSEGFE